MKRKKKKKPKHKRFSLDREPVTVGKWICPECGRMTLRYPDDHIKHLQKGCGPYSLALGAPNGNLGSP